MAALTHRDSSQAIVPLEAGDISRLRIGWRARLTASDIRQCLALAPGCSVWNPYTLEYAIAAPWRNRDDVVQIAELSSVTNPEKMVREVAELAERRGALLTVMVELEEHRRPIFFERCGFEHLEQVVTFDINRRDAPRVERPRSITFVPADTTDQLTLDTLLSVDNRAFPWLWWNSELEFQTYGSTPGVEIYIGLDRGEPVSYIGFTTFPGWGHVDRIAVLPDVQGSGYGLLTLAFAVETMGTRGARKIGLSTQSTNEQSQRLYRRYGFVRTTDNDYDLWGDTLRSDRGIHIPTPSRS